MGEGKHNLDTSLIQLWHIRDSQVFLVGKTNVRILRFLMQRSKIMCWKASPSYIFFPPGLGISKGENAFSSLYTLFFLLEVFHRE